MKWSSCSRSSPRIRKRNRPDSQMWFNFCVFFHWDFTQFTFFFSKKFQKISEFFLIFFVQWYAGRASICNLLKFRRVGDILWRFNLMIMYYPVMLSHFSPAPVKQIVRYESNKPVKSKLTYRQSIKQSTERFTMKVYAWLIDLIHRRKNCPTGMISGWVQKVTRHNGTLQYYSWRRTLLRGRGMSLKREFLLGDTDQSLGLVCSNGWSNGRSYGCCGFLGCCVVPSEKQFHIFKWESCSADRISQSYQESRAKTWKWKHGELTRQTETDILSINQL